MSELKRYLVLRIEPSYSYDGGDDSIVQFYILRAYSLKNLIKILLNKINQEKDVRCRSINSNQFKYSEIDDNKDEIMFYNMHHDDPDDDWSYLDVPNAGSALF